VPLADLIGNCAQTDISHDAGNFVCSHTYYEVLRHLDEATPCIFVHVPLLLLTGYGGIVEDFIQVLRQMHSQLKECQYQTKFTLLFDPLLFWN
jgi:pyroglutamyl-peptidase